MWNWSRLSAFCVLVLLCGAASGQDHSRLQIHYMDVGQGDGAVLISPGGQVVLFDDGVQNHCDRPLAYLEGLGITKIDYHIASHYHADHIGCASQILGQFALAGAAYDRGGTSRGGVFLAYLDAVGTMRATAQVGQKLVLEEGTAHPVTITFVAIAGNQISTNNDNDLSLVAVVEFGAFRTEFGGDLSGYKSGNYKDVETSVAPLVGRIDVYKVHHHCSSYSTNEQWLATTKPTVAIISVGDGNGYGHSAENCVSHLHAGGLKRVYWTENGKGTNPEPPLDVVAGTVVVEVEEGASEFTVSYNNGRQVERFAIQGAAPSPEGAGTQPTPPTQP